MDFGTGFRRAQRCYGKVTKFAATILDTDNNSERRKNDDLLDPQETYPRPSPFLEQAADVHELLYAFLQECNTYPNADAVSTKTEGSAA